jgi:hypothetical protein
LENIEFVDAKLLNGYSHTQDGLNDSLVFALRSIRMHSPASLATNNRSEGDFSDDKSG